MNLLEQISTFLFPVRGFRNQLVVVGFSVSGSTITLSAPFEVVHETPAPPYAPAITHVRDGVYFVAWAEGTSPEFTLRGELVAF